VAMLRHRERRDDRTPATLLYSSRSVDDVIYRPELDAMTGRDRKLDGPSWENRSLAGCGDMFCAGAKSQDFRVRAYAARGERRAISGGART